jgi:nucleotide-binding universal stress UspA family protein
MYEHILIPTDGKEETHEAVEPGLELASQHEATVHILHVVENDVLRQALALQTTRSMATAARQHGEEAVAKLRDLAEQYEVESVTWVLRARPAIGTRRAHETIVEYAETNDIDLVVMGATDRGRVSTMLRPSVTHRVMASTDVPVFGRRLQRELSYVSDRSHQVRSSSEFGE